MTKTITIAEGKNYKAINIGPLDRLPDHQFVHPLFKTIDKGRLFVGELLETSGAEVSFRELPAKTTIPFLHKHHQHEEIYIFLKGVGLFQADDNIFPVNEGSIIRVGTDVSRTLSNDAEEPMIYMVVQSHINSLAGYHVSDGYRVEGEIKI